MEIKEENKQKTKTLPLGVGKELLPSKNSEHNVSGIGYFAMWIGCAVVIATFQQGGHDIHSMSLLPLIIAVVAANVVTGIFITIAGDIGVEHGIPFPVVYRMSFGPIGCILPTAIRGIIACGWLGIQTYYGSTAMNVIFTYFFGFDNWMVCFILFLLVQIINAACGVGAIDKFAKFAAPCLIVISGWILFTLLAKADAQGIEVFRTVLGPADQMLSPSGLSAQVFIGVCFNNMSYWSTNTCDTQSLTKYVKVCPGERSWFKRNGRCLAAHCIALPLIHTSFIMIGAVAMIVLGDWNPINALQQTATGLALVAMLLLIILGQWSTNVATSILPPAYIFMNIVAVAAKRKLGYGVACFICGIIAFAMQPWNIMESFQSWLGIMGSSYGPLCGILIADYYILRKRRVNVPELYKRDGQFSGLKGVNLAGLITFCIGFIAAFFSGSYAWAVGTAVSTGLYYLLARFWWFKRYPQKEIESGYDEAYLGTTAAHDWEIEDAEF